MEIAGGTGGGVVQHDYLHYINEDLVLSFSAPLRRAARLERKVVWQDCHAQSKKKQYKEKTDTFETLYDKIQKNQALNVLLY